MHVILKKCLIFKKCEFEVILTLEVERCASDHGRRGRRFLPSDRAPAVQQGLARSFLLHQDGEPGLSLLGRVLGLLGCRSSCSLLLGSVVQADLFRHVDVDLEVSFQKSAYTWKNTHNCLKNMLSAYLAGDGREL